MTTTLTVRFIAVRSSESMHIPPPADNTGQMLHPLYEIGKLMGEAFSSVALWQYLAEPLKPSKWPIFILSNKTQWCGRGWSRWNILPGTGVAGAFYAKQESHPKLGYLSQDRSQSCSNIADFASMPEIRSRRRSRSTLLGTRIELARTSDSEPEHRGRLRGWGWPIIPPK